MAGKAYARQLRAHPLRTKAVTSGVLAGCSDAVAQKIAGARKLQLRRLLLITVPTTATTAVFASSVSLLALVYCLIHARVPRVSFTNQG
jgi:hypothetical protein